MRWTGAFGLIAAIGLLALDLDILGYRDVPTTIWYRILTFAAFLAVGWYVVGVVAPNAKAPTGNTK